MEPIVLATANPHKVEELRAIFGAAGVPVIGLPELPRGRDMPEPEETGRTFEENATIKALAYARLTGRACIADDSGLQSDALGGAPGVISSHYCTDGRATGMKREERDRLNNQRVLRELAGVPPERRTARFVCVMVLAGPPGKGPDPRGAGFRPTRSTAFSPRTKAAEVPVILARKRGVFEGRIGVPPAVPRGSNGFGYDPIFLVGPEHRLTSAELSPAEKNRLSHRGAAARAMAEKLRRPS